MTHWAWIDMEMTGLDAQQNHVLEVALIVTDLHFNTETEWECTISQPEEYLSRMDKWCVDTHTKSGLLERCKSGISEKDCENKLLEIVDRYFNKKDRIILAGNTIGQDRKFIDRFFPQFSSRLHYRMLDVSAWKVVFENLYGFKYKKQNNHRALDDIQESINELKFYMEFLDQSRLRSKISNVLTGVSEPSDK